jgi:N-acyl-D-amino-acid deacylase
MERELVQFDLLIRGGTVVDGSGAVPGRPADVGIVGDRITAIGALGGATAGTVIEAAGKIVSPGFIDVHIHSEIALLGGPYRYGALLQGVTTQLTGPDGFGWTHLPPEQARQLWESTLFAYGHGPATLDLDWPTAASYLALFAGNTPANIVSQVPHCAVRMAVMGWAARPATDDELARMTALTREWLEAGAVCLNLGLDYQPSSNADTRELIALSKVAREYGAIYAAHVRYNDFGSVGAWRETMTIGEQAGIPVHISHESVTEVTAPLLDEAAQRCDLTFESYLYPAGCTHLAIMLPTWAQQGGPAGIRRRLRDPQARERMRAALHDTFTASVATGAKPVFAATQTGRFIGQSIVEAANGTPLGEFAVRLLEEEDPYALLVYHRGTPPAQQEAIERETIRHPRMLVASDGIYHGAYAHPRGYGCFARILRRCVRELQAVTLEEAIYKMSGFPAERFNIKDRGRLQPGYGADVVIFDPATVADRATWDDARLEPVGIDYVIVNGQVAVEHGKPTGCLPGRVLR